MPVDRFAVAARLRELAELLTLDGASPFRTRAYGRAAAALENMSADFATLLAAKRLTELPGIGSALARTIEELAATGTTDRLENLRLQYPAALVELSRVLSLRQAMAVHQGLGVNDLDELRAACEAGRLRGLHGFGAKTEERLIARIDELQKQPGGGADRLLPEALAAAEALAADLRRDPGAVSVEIAGALRRRVETVGRIELVVASSDPPASIQRARNDRGALPPPPGPESIVRQASGLEAGVRIVPSSALAPALIDATGSAAHVAKLRQRATERGFDLTANALRRNGRCVALRTEAELYEKLGLAYVPPEMREDAGEVEAAADGTLPDGLVRAEDVRGIVHCHTVYSDGKHTIEEMAHGAEALGLRYLTITDHSASATYARGLSLDRLRRQGDEIARVQEKVGVRLLRGTESDILRDGSLDFPDAVLEQLDVVIASIHNRYRMDANQMTRRLVQALGHPLFKIWGHALGRYVLSRPPFACHMDELLDRVAGARCAIEVNGDPHRLDLEPKWIRAARRRGIRFVLSADAHSVNAMQNLRWAVDMARRGWLRPSDVLNTLDAREFATAVQP